MPIIRRRSVITNHAALYAPAPGGGGGTWDLTDLGSTLKLYANFNRPASITKSGSNITHLDDLSGNAKGFIVLYGSGPVEATLNSTRTVGQFTAADSFAQLDPVPPNLPVESIPTSSSTHTLIILARQRTTKKRIWAGTLDNYLFGWWNGNMRSWYDTTGFRSTDTTDDGDWHLFVGTVSSGTPALWDNGTSVTTSGTVASGPGSIALNLGGAGGDTGSDCEIFAVAACDTALSTGDREKVEGALLWEAGLQAKLPGGHTYAGAAP